MTPLPPAPNEREVFAMRKLILTGALFARLTRKDRLTLPYSYY
ncbi:cittilin family RiPP precursor [Streptomyces rugosispiralis]|uniref:Cittilin family RiPP n=1 Tax=Streptomyces rugosispiralis TaxID=2967341 RepID=A0ABT1V5L8_9ACTN|nr:cittilin family RiPP precursor [Streptomyces rugosispiralis]MCQ8191821.1 cittilin family RiPP precursor [Streptomyces rugosispiralis]